MRTIVWSALVLILSACGAAAQPHPFDWFWHSPNQKWCFASAVDLRDCSYPTFAACNAALNGVGGSCTLNPAYRPPSPPPARRHHRKRGS